MCLFLHECLFLCWQQFNRRRKGWQNWHENSHLSWKNTYLWTLICSVLRIFWYTKLHSCWYHTKKNTNYLLHSKVFFMVQIYLFHKFQLGDGCFSTGARLQCTIRRAEIAGSNILCIDWCPQNSKPMERDIWLSNL